MEGAAPVLRLPAVVLNLVFTIQLEEESYERGPDFTWGSRSPPFIASHVCAAWRNVAITNPLLWTTINISRLPWNIHLVHLWHTRSYPCLIDFYFTTSYVSLHGVGYLTNHARRERLYTHAIHTFDHFFDTVLAHHLPRYRTIFMSVTKSHELVGLLFLNKLSVFPAPITSLKHLSIRVHDYRPNTGETVQRLFPHGAPALTDVHVAFPFSLPSNSPPQLTHLHLDLTYHSMEDFTAIISQCSKLETLAVYNPLKRSSIRPEDIQPFELPSLSSVQFFDLATLVSLRLLLLFSAAPALRHVLIAPLEGNDLASFVKNYLPFQRRKLPTPEAVTLSLPGNKELWERSHMKSIHSCFPNVQHAVLLGSGVYGVLAALKVTSQPLWCDLRTLGLSRFGSFFSEQDVLDLTALRKAAGRPLEKLRIDRGSLARMTQLDSFKEAGVEVVEDDEYRLLLWAKMFYDKSLGLCSQASLQRSCFDSIYFPTLQSPRMGSTAGVRSTGWKHGILSYITLYLRAASIKTKQELAIGLCSVNLHDTI